MNSNEKLSNIKNSETLHAQLRLLEINTNCKYGSRSPLTSQEMYEGIWKIEIGKKISKNIPFNNQDLQQEWDSIKDQRKNQWIENIKHMHKEVQSLKKVLGLDNSQYR